MIRIDGQWVYAEISPGEYPFIIGTGNPSPTRQFGMRRVHKVSTGRDQVDRLSLGQCVGRF